MQTTYFAMARWGFVDHFTSTQQASAGFADLQTAQRFAEDQGGHDPHALLKVYEGYYDEDGDFVELSDWYYDGNQGWIR